MEQMQQDNSTDTTDSTTPLDEIISRVDSYIADPKLVTTDTLTQLKNDLVDLKSVIDQEETGESESDQGQTSYEPQNGEKPGLSIIIGMHRKKGGQ